jgi:two-component system sensor histidine kinase ChvG
MAWDIVLAKNDEGDLRLGWSARWSLTSRILAVNIFALASLAGGLSYLDSYRSRLIDLHLDQTRSETRLIAEAVAAAPPARRAATVQRLGLVTRQRIRLYSAGGAVIADSWRGAEPSYTLRDPSDEPWERHAARAIDRAVDRIVNAEKFDDFVEPAVDRADAWPEIVAARSSRAIEARVRRAPDITPMLSAATVAPGTDITVLTTRNARDITRIVRAERFGLSVVLGITIGMSVLLSLFLARTIVRPLRRLAIAAQRVRSGRAREVQVPRLPSRGDEIGTLARALSDMTQALRQRIDATDSFAADVTHELKNPLASLRSAVDSLTVATAPNDRSALVAIIRDDVQRLDRLINDISEASRLDAELSRARFEPVDLGIMIEGLVAAREARGLNGQVRLAFARPRLGSTVVMGDDSRLARVLSNLIDNAVSFSPPDGLVQIAATCDGERVIIRVEDDGPGVPPEIREEIFQRFHSIRPGDDAFGKHSGLGLAIARAIVDGHGGTIAALDRDGGVNGARFMILLPAAPAQPA